MSIKFYKDSVTRSYSRKVFSLLDVFGNIGGVNDVLGAAGAIIVGLFSGKIFLFTILSSMYQVDSTHIDQKKNAIKPIHQNTNITCLNEFNNKLKAESLDMYEENKFEEIKHSPSNKIINREINTTDLNGEFVAKAASNMRKRYRYSYSMFDFIYNLMMPFKAICCCKNRINNIHTRYKLFKKGQKKLDKEFDAVEFAKSQRKLKMLIYWLMDKSERFLAAYQKSNAISLSAESESLSDDPSYTKIPKMLDKEEIKKEHGLIVSRFFNEYLKETHTLKDENLLHGVYSQNPNRVTNIADKQKFK